jgi:hypothetical protein
MAVRLEDLLDQGQGAKDLGRLHLTIVRPLEDAVG